MSPATTRQVLGVAVLLSAACGPGSTSLTVTKVGDGAGTVTSDPAGIDCGAVCSASFAPGKAVKLSAAAAQGSAFLGWSGDCAGAPGVTSVTLSAGKSCAAKFELVPGTIVFSSFRNLDGSDSADPTTYDIWRVAADGTGLTPLTRTGFAQKPRWSPDGTRIVFEVWANGGGTTSFVYNIWRNQGHRLHC